MKLRWGSILRRPLRGARRALAIACVLGLLAGLAGACAPDRGRRDFRDAPLMSFAVDPSLLGSAVTDSALRVSFRPPLPFVPADPELHRRIREEVRAATRGGDPLASDPVLLFTLTGATGVCKVGRLLEAPERGLNAAWVQRCREEMARQVAPAEVQEDVFRIGEEVVAAQFLTQNSQMVLFRFLCQGPVGAPVVIDYLLPRQLYAEQVRAVEASIGSLRMF